MICQFRQLEEMNSSTGYILRSSQPTKGLQVLQSHMFLGYNLHKTYDDKRDYSS